MTDFHPEPTPPPDDERFRAEEWDEHLRAMADDHRERLERHSELGHVGWAPNYGKPDPKPPKRASRAESLGKPGSRQRWHDAVLERDQGCNVHPNPADCDEGWQAHHVVPQQVLRREQPAILWHPLVGMGVCGLAHRQHHSGVRPITQDEVPAPVVAFLRSRGFSAYLHRHYDLEWIA